MRAHRLWLWLAAGLWLCGLQQVARVCQETSRGWRAHELASLARDWNQLGKTEKALRAYGGALEIEPNLVNVHLEMAQIYAARSNWVKAEKCIDEALLRCPPESGLLGSVHRQRALLFWRSGQVPRARAEVDAALACDANDPLARRLQRRLASPSPLMLP